MHRAAPVKRIGIASALTALVAPLTAGCSGSATSVGDEPAIERRVTVYEYGEVGGHHLLLYPVKVDADRTEDAAVDAVAALIEHRPWRKGRYSLWNSTCAPAAGVESVDRKPNLITVHLKSFGPNEAGTSICDMSEQGHRIQIQQVAWTVRTATGSSAPVRAVFGDRQWRPATKADLGIVFHRSDVAGSR